MKLNYKSGGTLIPRCIKYNRNLDITNRVVLEALIDRDNGLMRNGETFYCNEEWLACSLGISIVTLKKGLKNLKEKGYISVSKEKVKGYSRNLYKINYNKIQAEDDTFKFPSLPEVKTTERLQRKGGVCYVYLMKDTSTENNYKIGISKTPKYREKTLQADEPMIEMIYSKKYSDRSTALLLEKTLHQLYDCKRMRGEWFNLNDEDVDHIQSLLKS